MYQNVIWARSVTYMLAPSNQTQTIRDCSHILDGLDAALIPSWFHFRLFETGNKLGFVWIWLILVLFLLAITDFVAGESRKLLAQTEQILCDLWA